MVQTGESYSLFLLMSAAAKSTVELGREGESRSVAYLESKGYSILERNYRGNGGEIDIIALSPDRETLVCIEVKSWSSFGIEQLEYGINSRKKFRIKKACQSYLLKNSDANAYFLRFDVIFFNGLEIEHLQGVF